MSAARCLPERPHAPTWAHACPAQAGAAMRQVDGRPCPQCGARQAPDPEETDR